ncbi:MAG: sulfate adenylyltransferase, partial [SAR324 cluster bacterium]|nr:sulfate adenylyltransferase [SAR324 cluster bacterium]
SRRQQFLQEAENFPSIEVSKADVSSIYRFSDGTLSPLKGPMDEEAWHQVLEENTIEYNFKKYAWTIPVSLPLTDEEAANIPHGHTAVLKNEKGEVFAMLKHTQVFKWDKPKYIKSVYGTDRTDHPGADMVLKDSRNLLIGGAIWALPQKIDPAYSEFVYSPRQTRLYIAEQKWDRAVAFQTRNPLHRAHEYALVAGVEQLTRKGFFTGVVLNPLIGELKGDDVPAKIRMGCYHKLLEEELLGQGDKDIELWNSRGYDLTQVFALIGLDIKMFYGGPKEAVMHAIYRQNHGFTDIIIGRKHADAPYHDGTAIWGDFDAQEIFESLQGNLEIQPCKIGFAGYYESMKRVDLMENHPGEKPLSISGSKIRESLRNGETPDPRIIRPEISAILIDYYKQSA